MNPIYSTEHSFIFEEEHNVKIVVPLQLDCPKLMKL